ncbi:unnamed protein product, partial [Heterosigma akashiwo]
RGRPGGLGRRLRHHQTPGGDGGDAGGVPGGFRAGRGDFPPGVGHPGGGGG